jgi:site-specific recombinase XerD
MPDMDGTNLLNWRDFERDLKLLNRSPRTIQSYEEAVNQLLAFAAGEWCTGPCEHAHRAQPDLTEQTKASIQDYLLEVLERHSDQTAANRFRSLRRFYNWMVKEEVLTESPMKRLGEPKPAEKLIAVPPIEHVRALLVTCEGKRKYTDPRRKFNDVRDAAMIRLFCEAGAPRVAEMAGIQLAHLDMTQDVVALHGKGNKWRVVPFGAKTGKAFTRYLRERPKHPLVAAARHGSPDGPAELWLGWRGKPIAPSGIFQMIERRCWEAEIPRIHPHALRHFAVDAFYADGGTEQDAMTLFGWSSPVMAHHYAKATAGRRAIKAARRASIGDQL